MSTFVEAFLIGCLSASSLPLGTLTSFVWKPSGRAVAFLMAFGGGALLAALTIDLVGSALEKGHFFPLAVGCIFGGMLFVVLNEIVNNQGGFLRKPSTTIFYLRRRTQRRFEALLRNLGRIGVFSQLSAEEAENLARSVSLRTFPRGTTFYQVNDPDDYLYVVDSGTVELRDPDAHMEPFLELGSGDAFGRMAFLTRSPHATVAVAISDVQVWMLPAAAFDELLQSSDTLADALCDCLLGEETGTYLRKRHEMEPEEAGQWIDQAVRDIRERRTFEGAVDVKREREELKQVLSQIGRLELFKRLPDDEIEEIAANVFLCKYEPGYTVFHPSESADRMYILKSGEVALLDRSSHRRTSHVLKPNDAFGAMSFLTGAPHAVTAVATTEVEAWVLRKRDFDELLGRLPGLADAVREYLRREEVAEYLLKKQHFDVDKTARWVREAARAMDGNRHLPPAAELADSIKDHKAAPLAIWLGILLDGIPESLVIGASMIHSTASLSLIVGLFISNYPEALSSSVGMRQQGFSAKRILFMWTALMLITGVGAALGNLFFIGAPPILFSLIEGIAAGAMLTMIAETMLPEAYFKGGSIVGIATLLGFLAAIFCTTLE